MPMIGHLSIYNWQTWTRIIQIRDPLTQWYNWTGEIGLPCGAVYVVLHLDEVAGCIATWHALNTWEDVQMLILAALFKGK